MGDDAGCGADGGQVKGGDFGMGLGGQTEGEVEGTRGEGDIIDIPGLAGDVEGGAIVREGEASGHGWTLLREVEWVRSSDGQAAVPANWYTFAVRGVQVVGGIVVMAAPPAR